MSVVETTDPRLMVERLVLQKKREVGKRMLAYEAVGRALGVSAWWVRTFIAGTGNTQEHGNVALGLSIQQHYARVCERIEANNERRRAKIARFEDRINAAATRNQGMVSPMASRTTTAEDA